jgi:ATP-dependent Clp protease ATP-binding subunit ClpA
MTVELFALVRRLPNGRVIAASVDYPGVTAEHETEPTALAALERELRNAIRRSTPTYRTSLGQCVEPALVPIPIELRLSQKGTRGGINVDVMVVRRPTSGGDYFIARVAGMRDLEVVGDDFETLIEQTKRTLTKTFASEYSVEVAFAFDSVGEAHFETIEVTLRPTSESADSDDFEDSLLEELGDNLVVRAEQDQLAPFDRRDALVDRVLAVLAAAGRSSVLLVGSPDVGKTTLVNELARRLASGDVPDPLRGRELWRIPANELIAGTRYSGMWQDRARRLVAEARDTGSILMMGDPSAILDAGRWSESSNNLGRFLRTYVESGEISIICEATEEIVAAAHRQEPSFVDVFQRVDVPEPKPDEALAILQDAAARLAHRMAVPIDESAVGAAVELTRRYEPYRSLPGKAVHLLEEAVRDVVAGGAVRRADVVAAFAARSGLPHDLLSDEAPLDLEAARHFFVERVLGQPDAIDAVVELLGVVKAGLNAPEKPLGTFFFIGPTGVGKTELAKALAEFLFGDRDRLLRFDMGEYGLRDAIPRLIGTAWQSDDEGELTRRVREQPFCVVLLDEIEKAHPDVFDVLLSMLGEGRLTDSNGRTADFRNAILIMTSNLGAARRQSGAIGFASGALDERERLRGHYREQVQEFFRPEFVNRIDRVVAFDELDRDVVRRIARREVGRLLLREGIVRRQLLVEVDDAAIEKLADAGFDPQFGARPLQRQIEHAVISPVARLIVTKRPQPGDVVRVHVADGELCVDIEPPPPTPEERREAKRERRAAPARASAARAAEAVQQLLDELNAELSGPFAESVRLEMSALVERTKTPTFWDAADDAREVMSRVYSLERVLDRLTRLQGRTAGLLELAGHVRRTGERARVPEVFAAVEAIADDFELARLELAGASAGGNSEPVVVRVTPIGSHSAGWADELAAMYRAWAERTGRETEIGGNGAAAVTIRGPATYELLANECGIHRRRFADHRELDARVSVNESSGDAVVRVYEEGRRNVVRDPRTNTRASSLDDVLRAGHLEQFLLAALRAGR